MKVHNEDEQRTIQRLNTQDNRKTWTALGFRQSTIRVHDLDRSVITAYAKLMLQKRLVEMVDNDDVKYDNLTTIMQRNMSSTPPLGELNRLTKKSMSTDIRVAADECKQWLEKRKRADIAYEDDRFDNNPRLIAKVVAYNNLAVAYFNYALALDEYEKVELKDAGDYLEHGNSLETQAKKVFK